MRFHHRQIRGCDRTDKCLFKIEFPGQWGHPGPFRGKGTKSGSVPDVPGRLATMSQSVLISVLISVPRPFHLMAGLLTIPTSNADAERGFSILRKIHTDQRSNLSQSTIIALMSINFNADSCCYDAEIPP